MSSLLAPSTAAALHLLLSAGAVVWNMAIGRRIAQRRDAPPVLAALSAIAALLIVPAVFTAAAADSLLTGRVLYAIAWAWPLTTLLVAAQALYALAAGRVALPIGLPIAAYDVLVAAVAVTRYAILLGASVPAPMLSLPAAQSAALDAGAQVNAATAPLFLYVPLLSPGVTPLRRRFVPALRGAVAALALAWTALTLITLPRARHGVRGYARYAAERLQERPQGDFAIGLKLFPALGGKGPPDVSVANDLALAKQMDAQALSVYIRPGRVSDALLDSLGHVLDESRRAGTILIAALALSDEVPAFGRPPGDRYFAARAAEVEHIVRRLRPDYVVPAVGRIGGARRVPLAQWRGYLERAAAASHRVRPRTRVMLHIAGFGARDSALYAWASRPGSPIDALSFRLYPTASGATGLDARMAAADRWMAAQRPGKEHWVLEAGGLPLAHGERSQERATWGAIAWAARHRSVRGVVIYEASDYGSPVGLRTSGGRVRSAARAAERAIRTLRETRETPAGG